jgi:hypothetical protein
MTSNVRSIVCEIDRLRMCRSWIWWIIKMIVKNAKLLIKVWEREESDVWGIPNELRIYGFTVSIRFCTFTNKLLWKWFHIHCWCWRLRGWSGLDWTWSTWEWLWIERGWWFSYIFSFESISSSDDSTSPNGSEQHRQLFFDSEIDWIFRSIDFSVSLNISNHNHYFYFYFYRTDIEWIHLSKSVSVNDKICKLQYWRKMMRCWRSSE